MGPNVSIDIDRRTADVLEVRAAELGVTVPELIADWRHYGTPATRRHDRRTRSPRCQRHARLAGSTGARGPVASDVGHVQLPTVAGPVEIEWSLDALADLNRFAAFLHDQFQPLRRRLRMLASSTAASSDNGDTPPCQAIHHPIQATTNPPGSNLHKSGSPQSLTIKTEPAFPRRPPSPLAPTLTPIEREMLDSVDILCGDECEFRPGPQSSARRRSRLET